MNIVKLSDNELIALAQANDEKAMNELMGRYKYVPTALARTYFLVGGDNDDLLQEGMIGVVNAINTFNDKKGEFKTYVYSCVKNRILSCIKSFTAKKHLPLNEYISLSSCIDGDDKTLIIQDPNLGPEELLITHEAEQELEQKIKDILTKTEYEIFRFYISGLSYAKISEKTNKQIKSVDNTVQRIKKKLRLLLYEK